jgi:hypothetical protein
VHVCACEGVRVRARRGVCACACPLCARLHACWIALSQGLLAYVSDDDAICSALEARNLLPNIVGMLEEWHEPEMQVRRCVCVRACRACWRLLLLLLLLFPTGALSGRRFERLGTQLRPTERPCGRRHCCDAWVMFCKSRLALPLAASLVQ